MQIPSIVFSSTGTLCALHYVLNAELTVPSIFAFRIAS